MYFNYKLDNGKYLKLFDHDLLRENKNDFFYRDGSEGIIVDDVNDYNGKEVYVSVSKDKEKLYFKIGGQKIYISDFEYYAVADLINRIKMGKEVSFDMFIASLIKESDKLAFIEQKTVPDSVSQVIPGHITYSYSYPMKFKNVICIPVENFFEKSDWHYKLETIPISEYDKLIYGIEKHDSRTFYDEMCMGYMCVINREDVPKYDFSDEKPFVRAYKKKG